MFGAFHLRALLLIGRGLHTLGYVISAFGVRHPFLLFSSFLLKTFPSFLVLENAIQFISQHIIKYFVYECMKLAMHEIMTRTCEKKFFFKFFTST